MEHRYFSRVLKVDPLLRTGFADSAMRQTLE